MPDAPEYLVVGHLNKAHGTKGEVFAWPLTDRPGDSFAPGIRLLLGDERGEPVTIPRRDLRVTGSRPFRRGFLVRFEGVEDRDGAEGLAGRYVLRPMAELAEREDGELFYHELLGSEVRDERSGPLGTVREVFELEPAHLLQVVGPRGEHLIPLSRQVVRSVDRERSLIVVELPDGWLDL